MFSIAVQCRVNIPTFSQLVRFPLLPAKHTMRAPDPVATLSFDRVSADLPVSGDRHPAVPRHSRYPFDVPDLARQLVGNRLDSAGDHIGAQPHQCVADAEDVLVDVESDALKRA